MSKVAVIGSGFSGLSAAAYLSAEGHEVHVFEKNPSIGGRARQIETDNGYVFDMGPSWYWMPDVFERFFNDFGHSASDFYHLQLLDPAFDVVFGQKTLNIPHNFGALSALFESIEKGSAKKLEEFMEEAQFKYDMGMKNLVYMPGLSISEFADIGLIKGAMRLQVFSSFSKHIRKFFSHPQLLALMEFPVLFLGAMPQDTPALYSLMNYAGLKLGTWYPSGGFGKVIDAIAQVARVNGTNIHINAPVEEILVEKDLATGVRIKGEKVDFDGIVAGADYHHVESQLLPKAYRNYDDKYWEKRTFAPSCLIYYLGIKKKLNNIRHHTLFFEEDLLLHSHEIYKTPQWPTKPLFYACCPSKSDKSVAPEGHENLFLLMPLAPGLQDGEELREKYFAIMMERLQRQLGEEIIGHIDYKQSYCVRDFVADYHSYKGNAYGLANTLRQTALLKPKIKNKKIKNLFYTGQLTVPGPGVPPALISGKIAANEMIKNLIHKRHEAALR